MGDVAARLLFTDVVGRLVRKSGGLADIFEVNAFRSTRDFRTLSARDTKMSSPSPGKRRMDTDVVKLYPFQNINKPASPNQTRSFITTVIPLNVARSPVFVADDDVRTRLCGKAASRVKLKVV